MVSIGCCFEEVSTTVVGTDAIYLRLFSIAVRGCSFAGHLHARSAVGIVDLILDRRFHGELKSERMYNISVRFVFCRFR